MTPEIKTTTPQNKQLPENLTSKSVDFCKDAVETMCKYYEIDKSDFEHMLELGFTEIRYGRSPLGYSDEKTGEYITAFAAFFKKDSRKLQSFEVRKLRAAFGNVALGVKRYHYTERSYQKTCNRFELKLVTEDLSGFIQRFNWPQF